MIVWGIFLGLNPTLSLFIVSFITNEELSLNGRSPSGGRITNQGSTC